MIYKTIQSAESAGNNYIEAPIVYPTKDNDDPTPHLNYKYVDLGLPSGTLWATSNIGTESETGVGQYFQWGSTVGKYSSDEDAQQFFTFSAYKFYTGESSSEYSVYSDPSNYSKYNQTDSKVQLDLEDDPAYVNMGEDWRTPTLIQMQELCNSCNTQWYTDYNQTGVPGMLYTSRINGNTLFVPASGSYEAQSGGALTQPNMWARLWTSTLAGLDDNKIWVANMNNYGQPSKTLLTACRAKGMPVRGVRAQS